MAILRLGALVIRHETEPEILLIRHRRRGRSYTVLPGGKIEKGETVEQAFEREVREESGLEVCMGRLLFVADLITPDHQRHDVNLVFRCTIVGGQFQASLHLSPSLVERGDRAFFVPLTQLGQQDLHPPLAALIQSAYAGELPEAVQYLGNVWQPFADEA